MKKLSQIQNRRQDSLEAKIRYAVRLPQGAQVSPGEPQVKLHQFFEKMLPAFIIIVKPSVA